MSQNVALDHAPEDDIGTKLSEVKTLVSVFVAASTGRDEFDYEGFALMMEDKFQEFYDLYHEAQGSNRRYQRFSSK
jgi:hypothetical protein